MLTSTKIQRRQSEIRQQLAELVGKPELTEDETRQVETLDQEYRANETRFRAALIAEDTERRETGSEFESREGKEWGDLVSGYELRQVVLHLDEGRQLEGKTAEVVQELRSRGGFRGIPLPLDALETRNTVSTGVPDPVATQSIIDRLFPGSVAGQMGAEMVNIQTGSFEYPLTSSSVAAGWAATEGGDVAGPTQYTTASRTLVPDHTLGITMQISRRALKQAASLEEAIRRDMRGAIAAELDRAAFLGTGASGQPLGVIAGAATYGITSTAVDAAATWAVFRTAITSFLTANAASGPGSVRVLIRPELWDDLDGTLFDAGSGITEFQRLAAAVGAVVMSSNALAAPSGTPLASTAVLMTTAGVTAPFFIATWGAVDMIRDPYSDAASGGLRLTGLITADVSAVRAEQTEVLTGLQ